MFRKYLITVALIIGFSSIAMGEKLSLASASFEYIPSAELDRAGTEYDEVKTSSQTVTVKLALPLLLDGKKTVLLNFFTLRSLYQTYGDVNPGTNLYRPDYLYTLKYGLVFLQRLSEKWKLAVLVQPSILSDLESVDSEHLVLRAGCLVERKVSERLKYSIGVGYSDDYGQVRVLPVVRLRWKSGEKWDFDLDLPSKARAWYNLSLRVRLGMAAKVTGAHFRVGEAVDLGNGVSTENGRVKYSILNFGPAVGYSIYKGAYLTFNTGFSLFRRFQLFDVNDNKLEQSDFERSLFFKTTIDYNVGG